MQELAQALLLEVVASRRLTTDTFAAFHGCALWDVDLSFVPGVTDAWLDAFAAAAPSAATLQRLSLRGCRGVTGAGLRRLSGCAQLRSLTLDGCTRVGDDGIASLAPLTSLVELRCEGCVLLTARALEHLQTHTRLQSLDLSMCRGVASLAPLARLTQLRCLRLGWTAATNDDVRHLCALSALNELQLCRTRVGDDGLAVLADALPQLHTLDMAGCPLTEACGASLGSFPALRALSLAGCAVGDACMAALARGAPALRSLNLAHTRITDEGVRNSLAALPLLEDVDLECCTVSDPGVLRGCLALRRLRLCDTATNNAGVERLRGLPLNELDLSFSGITDAALLALSPTLTSLRLDTRGVTDAGLRHLAHLSSLRRLDLFGARVGDAGMALLVSLKHTLRALDVCSGGVSDAGVVHVAKLTLLETLNLSQNWRITDASIAPLCSLPHVQSLGLSGTRVTGAGVLLLESLAPPTLLSLAVYGCKVAPEAAAAQARRPSLRITWTEEDGAADS